MIQKATIDGHEILLSENCNLNRSAAVAAGARRHGGGHGAAGARRHGARRRSPQERGATALGESVRKGVRARGPRGGAGAELRGASLNAHRCCSQRAPSAQLPLPAAMLLSARTAAPRSALRPRSCPCIAPALGEGHLRHALVDGRARLRPAAELQHAVAGHAEVLRAPPRDISLARRAHT